MGNPPLLLSRQADRQCKLHLASQRSVPCSVTASSAPSECKFLLFNSRPLQINKVFIQPSKTFLSIFSLSTFKFALESVWQTFNCMCLSLRLSRTHDSERLQVSLPGVVSAHYEALCLHVCQPRWEKGQNAHHGSSESCNTFRSTEPLDDMTVCSLCILGGGGATDRTWSGQKERHCGRQQGENTFGLLGSSSRAWVRGDAMCHGFTLLGLRCSWSEVCCVTWSSRGTSRSPVGWSICRPPAWDIWPGRNTANSRLAARFSNDPVSISDLYADDTLLFLWELHSMFNPSTLLSFKFSLDLNTSSSSWREMLCKSHFFYTHQSFFLSFRTVEVQRKLRILHKLNVLFPLMCSIFILLSRCVMEILHIKGNNTI